MKKILEAVLALIGVFSFAILLGFIFAYPIKWTWNYTMPYLFDLKTISWGQAWCLNFLTSCLIKTSLTTSKS